PPERGQSVLVFWPPTGLAPCSRRGADHGRRFCGVSSGIAGASAGDTPPGQPLGATGRCDSGTRAGAPGAGVEQAVGSGGRGTVGEGPGTGILCHRGSQRGEGEIAQESGPDVSVPQGRLVDLLGTVETSSLAAGTRADRQLSTAPGPG